ncbi:hypothetical protein J2Y45_006762 [Dyadobacter sp. BE34]|uniref:DUF3945 domain-containing protein n=1 Tax=Dyadobacter fermentans TaxID=94254 RepID=A0ABU1R8G6_9BACT|nr:MULTISPECIES: hypothetical protein [Dyadobacter]MDR6809685.1 hypothetical protein [Dyadobacter fermentans]MDR7047363.1 hypothetical protein [Dyadobacter sp. BE242]MDR7201598.1 hypothetical protein [Dyadobacter sp. BE34]MDR7219468.1 hypothetical protein [Dyadobacter sp. BE31]MDR7267137.1 hypothetical protein [Dyadobacter sp. BE32]
MNEKNHDYLKDQLKYTGFGEDAQAQLRDNLMKAQNEFSIKQMTAYGKDELSVSLNFKKSTNSDMYFFNNYRAELAKPGSDVKISQTFYMNNEGRNITQKEAYNLLDGRSVNKDLVNKDGQIHNAWVKLDFKETTVSGNYKMRQFSPEYGFELEKTLEKFPLKELLDPKERVRLLESLERGNRQAVTFKGEDGEQKRFIEANPQFKSVTIYDQNQKRLRQAIEPSQKAGESQDKGQENSAKNRLPSNEVVEDNQGKRRGIK